MVKLIYRLVLLIGIATNCYAEVYTYDGVHVGMNLDELKATNYHNCTIQHEINKHWLTCSSSQNFYPNFLGYSVDDVEIELPDGKLVSAINLITSYKQNAQLIAKKTNGKASLKGNAEVISIPNHQDGILLQNGRIAIINNSTI